MGRKGFLYFAVLALSLSLLTACGSGGSSSNISSGVGGPYAISGTMSGLTGTGLVLQNNGADDLAVAPTDTRFTFTTKIASNAVYSITVFTGPTGTNPYQTCAVSNGTGTIASADVTNVLVTCSTSTWETLATLPDSPRFSDFTPAGQSVLYTLGTNSVFAFTFPTAGEPLGHFSALTGTNAGFSSYTGPAWVNGKLYQVQDSSVYAYDIAGNSWTRPVNGSLMYAHDDVRCTGDDSGYVYSLATSTHVLLKFNTADSTFRSFASPTSLNNNETRVAWDSRTGRVYLGNYGSTVFYAFNPVAETFTPLAPVPGTGTMSDALCSDRRGHVFTSNTDGSEVWMYTAATDTWSQFLDTPFAHGDWESCTVSADGWLYYGSGTVGFGRFKIF
jgi:hypothetical protein